MERFVRFGQLVGGCALLYLAVAYFLQWPWALAAWPWAGAYTGLSPLSAIFLSSIFAAIAVPVLWIAFSGETAAARTGSLNVGLVLFGLTIFMLQTANGDQQVLNAAIVCAVCLALTIGILIYSSRLQPRDKRPLPGPVRASFVVFTILLILVGGALVLRAPKIFPWPLTSEMSVVYGWIFLGSAVFFADAVIRPGWYNAIAPLLGFLAYDLVLIVPYVQHFATVQPDLRISLIVYVGVLIYSGILAFYYLFVNKATRIFGSRQVEQVVPGSVPS
jgi:hypothetical protein